MLQSEWDRGKDQEPERLRVTDADNQMRPGFSGSPIGNWSPSLRTLPADSRSNGKEWQRQKPLRDERIREVDEE